MAVMDGDHGAGSFRSMSPPARMDAGEHDVGMLSTPGHVVKPPVAPTAGYEIGGGMSHGVFKVGLDQDMDRGI